MNARQKAKKYKQQLDLLQKKTAPIKLDIANSTIEILGASVTYYGGCPSEKAMRAELAEIIAYNPDFRQNIEVYVDHVPYSDVHTVTGRLKVVMPDA